MNDESELSCFKSSSQLMAGVLVAISIPIFSAQLNKAKQAADVANARSIYAAVVADYLDDETFNNAPTGTLDNNKGGTITVGSEKYKFSDICTAFTYTAPATGTEPSIEITTNGTTFKFPGNVDGTTTTTP